MNPKFYAELHKEYLWYREELIALLEKHDLHIYVSHVVSNGMKRWYPEEVVNFLELVDEARNNSYPAANASIKHIPDFLLK